MKYILTTTLFIILSCRFCYSQDSLKLINIDDTISQVYVVRIKPIECPYTIEHAQQDIYKDTLTLIIQGGFTGFGHIDEKKSEKFQKKYKVKFEYLGCSRWWDIKDEDLDGYNKIVLDHLTQKYDKSVLKEFKEIKK